MTSLRIFCLLYQNCHGYVTSGFNMTIDPNKNYTVTSRPTLVFQGINSKLVEQFKLIAGHLTTKVSDGIKI